MTPERWRQIERLLQEALEREPAERVDFLERACAGDPGLREELELLLASQPAESFLAANALDRLGIAPVANLRGPDDPGIVGQLQYVAHDRAGDGNGCGARQGTSQQLAERFPSGLQARMRVRAKCGGIAEARDAAMVNVGDGEPRMRSSDIDGYEFH